MPPLKQKYYSPPKNKLVVENRIIDGKKRKVETYNGKVARVYDDDWKLLEDRSGKLKVTLPTPPLVPRIRQENKLDDTPLQEDKSKEESPILDIPSFTSTSTQADEKMMSGTGGLQIIPENEVAKPGDVDIIPKDIPREENVEIPKIEEVPKSESLKIEEVPKSESLKIEEVPKSESLKIEEVPKTEGTVPKTEGTIDGTTDSLLSQQLDKIINIQDISNKVDIPKIDPQKEAPNKIEIPKETPKQTNVPKEAQEMGVPGVPIKKMENRIEKLIDKKTSSTQIIITNDKPKVDKITEVNKAEQQKKPIEDKIIKENKNMVEELLEEYKREQWAKKRDFDKNIEDMARVASENKGQIKEISQKIEGVGGKVEEVEEKIGGLQENIQERFKTIQERFGTLQESLQERLGDMKKPVTETLGELCTGVDCIKTDLKKSQEYQQSLEKQLEGKFQELSERLQKLEEPSYVCDNCGADSIKPLSSFCPNCGAPIHSWTDPETGNPISGWAPYWKRTGRQSEFQ